MRILARHVQNAHKLLFFYIEPEPRHELEAINSIGKPPQQQEIPLKPDTVEKILKPDIVLPDDAGFPVNVTSINP